jgi:hypothetical protein
MKEPMMSTVVDLTEQEIAEILALTKEVNVVAAVRSALAEYVRFACRMKLKDLSGHVEMDENWQELESSELRNGSGTS